MLRRSFLLGGLAVSAAALTGCTLSRPDPTSSASAPVTGGTPTPTASAPVVPQPVAFARSTWSTDPFSLGSGSYLPPGSTDSDRDVLAAPIADRIFLAGEFLAGESSAAAGAGTVAGAWASGARAAGLVGGLATAGERIAILGAGAAGAAAAQRLHAAGHDVVVLEARDRVGGRIDSVSGADWPFPVELGAFLLPDPVANPLIGELAALEVETALIETPGETRTVDGAVVESPVDVAALVRTAAERTREADGDRPLSEAVEDARDILSGTGDSPVGTDAWIDEYLISQVEESTGAEASDLSARSGYESDDAPPRIVLGGFQRLVESALAEVDVRLSNAVAGVSLTDEGVGLILVNGESFSADRVIVAVPLGVLQNETISFDPPLPQGHLTALTRLREGKREAVVVRFEERFWDTDAVEWTVVGGDALVGTWYNLEPLTGEPVLLGQIAADAAVDAAALSDDEIRDAALASLAPFVAG